MSAFCPQCGEKMVSKAVRREQVIAQIAGNADRKIRTLPLLTQEDVRQVVRYCEDCGDAVLVRRTFERIGREGA